jgi:hypothetical protein
MWMRRWYIPKASRRGRWTPPRREWRRDTPLLWWWWEGGGMRHHHWWWWWAAGMKVRWRWWSSRTNTTHTVSKGRWRTPPRRRWTTTTTKTTSVREATRAGGASSSTTPERSRGPSWSTSHWRRRTASGWGRDETRTDPCSFPRCVVVVVTDTGTIVGFFLPPIR